MNEFLILKKKMKKHSSLACTILHVLNVQMGNKQLKLMKRKKQHQLIVITAPKMACNLAAPATTDKPTSQKKTLTHQPIKRKKTEINAKIN